VHPAGPNALQFHAQDGVGVVADQNGGHIGLLVSPVWLTVRPGGGQYAATCLPGLDGSAWPDALGGVSSGCLWFRMVR
jgi:hypothetical protein